LSAPSILERKAARGGKRNVEGKKGTLGGPESLEKDRVEKREIKKKPGGGDYYSFSLNPD